MRLRLALAISALPIIVASYLVACSSEAKIEDLCGWLGDDTNCYRTFASDVNAQCGAFVMANTPPNDSAQPSPRHGNFLKRDKLDLCVFDSLSGGQVIFDPPLDVATFPVTTASFAIRNGDGTLCGAGAVGLDGAFAISIESSPTIPDAGGGGAGGSPDCSSASQICGGTFSISSVTERELADTKCPSGETHHFNRLQLAKCDGDQAIEQDLDQLMPRAELLSDAGSVGNNGYVRFRVFYPPAISASSSTGGLSTQEPVVVEYFECSIPGANPTCGNGVQDDGEPSTDCGAICGRGCPDNSLCYINNDCASHVCKPDPTGILKCAKSPTCMDGTKNPGEGDIDCGTQCGNTCADCKSCLTDLDCGTNNCKSDGKGGFFCQPDGDAGCSMGSSSSSGAGGAGGAGGSGGTGGV